MSVLLPGDYFGETALLKDEVSSYAVIALEDTEVCSLNHLHLRNLLLENQEIAISVIQSLLERVADREHVVFEQSLIPADERVFKALNHYKSKDGFVILPIAQKDLANSLGITPETFSRSLVKLENEGSISRIQNKIKIIK